MNYEELTDDLLERNMTEKGFDLWVALKEKIPPVWDRLSSSTKKYHQKSDGHVPSISEHSYEMLLTCIKIWSMFDIQSKTTEADTLLLAISLHDSFKYGLNPDERTYTISEHDQLAADKIVNAEKVFKRHLSDEQFDNLVDAVRFHSGRWSTDVEGDFNFNDRHPYSMFVHTLDMLSTKDCIKT